MTISREFVTPTGGISLDVHLTDEEIIEIYEKHQRDILVNKARFYLNEAYYWIDGNFIDIFGYTLEEAICKDVVHPLIDMMVNKYIQEHQNDDMKCEYSKWGEVIISVSNEMNKGVVNTL